MVMRKLEIPNEHGLFTPLLESLPCKSILNKINTHFKSYLSKTILIYPDDPTLFGERTREELLASIETYFDTIYEFARSTSLLGTIAYSKQKTSVIRNEDHIKKYWRKVSNITKEPPQAIRKK
ncbi:unnamed protein product [Lepeophtheirus salmonis]|uniref:(salmon louse) hypothetical protein n=1 Tax=Lepeophtheirus salmonis TaxID=72036 RepID=A0A7R8D3M4_LEPSM|nr:unnamed protein product [Lepeophtheirus salmonis]CAF2985832.1 unnamed protein product [Lepeophtheirus salmonis]